MVFRQKPRCSRASNCTKLSATEQIIIDLISTNILHIDEIITAAALSPADVLSSLMSLELTGIVEQHPGKFFSRKN